MATSAGMRAIVKSNTFARRWIRASFWLLALTLAALQVWAAVRSSSMNADGIAYLDMGDAYLRGDWSNAVNPVWSPLYSWILGAVMAVVQPPMAWEFPVVHLVNLALFLLALLCFDFFWRQLSRYRREAAGPATRVLPDWAWLAIGYSLFVWVTLSLIAVWAVTPDMLMAALVLIAAGLIVRMRLGHAGWRPYLLLGLILGAAYLSKAVMFPLAFVFLGTAWLSARSLRRAAPRAGGALLIFLLVGLPYVLAISRSHGSLTIGEAGTITYIRHVAGITDPHWQGYEPDTRTHPSRQLLNHPPVYEFAGPIGGTYPISYNPAYWFEGATAEIDWGRQAQTLAGNGLYYARLFGWQQGGLLALTILLYVLSPARRASLPELGRRWGLLLPALAALLLYGLVYAEDRYIGVFLLLLWGDLLANVRLAASPAGEETLRAASILMAGFLLLNIAAFNLEGYGRLADASAAMSQDAPPAPPVAVATSLRQLGVAEGSTVGVIGYAYDSFWARLARVQIVAELVDYPGNPFWAGDASLQQSVLQAFASSGACAVVAEYAPAGARLAGWQQVNDSSFYIYLLREEC
jgi:hypothetical protein